MVPDHSPASTFLRVEDGGHGWRENRGESLIADHQDQQLKLKMIEEVSIAETVFPLCLHSLV